MTIGCNIWMICLKLNWFFYGLSRMLQFSQFVWILCSSVLVVFINFLLIYATDRSKISSNQKHFFIALSLYPLSFFANSPFKQLDYRLQVPTPVEKNYLIINSKEKTMFLLRDRSLLNGGVLKKIPGPLFAPSFSFAFTNSLFLSS